MTIRASRTTILLVLVCGLAFLYGMGCRSVYAQGQYARVGQIMVADLGPEARTAIRAVVDAQSDPIARGQALWAVAQEYEKGDDFAAALAAYEEIRRSRAQSPGKLDERINWCQARLEVGRRWSDAKLLAEARGMSLEKGLGLYREVARTVHDNYVDEVNYQTLLGRGITNLRAGAASADFRKAVGATEDADRLAAWGKALDEASAALAAEPKDLTSFAARHWARKLSRQGEELAGIPAGVVLSELLFGSAGHLDHYSLYLTQPMYEALTDDISGQFVGLGIEIREERDDGKPARLLVVTVFDGGPASKAGMKAGDELVNAGGVDLDGKDIDAAVKVLRGEKGSAVEVTVRRGGDLVSFHVVRDEVNVPSVRNVSRIGAEDAYGYIAIGNFQRTTGPEVSAALDRLEKDGTLRGMVIDLRGNPGGLLDAAVDVCSLLLEKGVVLTTKGRGFNQTRTYKVSHWRYSYHDVPLVVLIDGRSASASEIVAGALHDHHRATLVGSQSYGKGVVQSILPVEAGQSAVYLTTARYYGPDDESFHGVGIAPDVAVAEPERLVGAGVAPDAANDPALAKALDVLSAKEAQPAVALVPMGAEAALP